MEILQPNITLIQTIALWLMMALPVLSFLLLMLVGKGFKQQGATLATLLQGLGWLLALFLLGQDGFARSYDWFKVGSHQFSISLLADTVALWMAFIVTFISFLVHLFSIEYMKSDPSKYRYFALLSLFTFAMLGIVMAGNVLLIFVFWELVGLSSYLLIGFWYKKQEASQASKKAFLMNRLGDAGFLVGIMILWTHLGSLDLGLIQQSNFSGFDNFWLIVAGLGILCGVIGKSAQFPLQTWLPGAMEGPTPVSALIHAATMVAAGVYLLVRLHPVFNFEVQQTMMLIGSITALMAALAALAQNDIKKVLAYSTVSQLGYMVMAAGAGAFGTAFFHLSTHAFFKAGLFLAAGSVIHSLHHKVHEQKLHVDVQDMRMMGGFKKYLPKTFISYTLLAASLCGLPFFSGFLSKEGILAALWNQSSVIGNLALGIALLSVLITPLYMGRQWLMVFWGKNRSTLSSENLHESGLAITVPLMILAVFSFSIWIGLNPFDPRGGWLFNKITFLHFGQHHAPIGLAIIGILAALGGLALAYGLYGRKDYQSDKDIFQKEWLHQHFYQDRFYQKAIIAKVVMPLSIWINWLDKAVIDRLVNGLGILHVVNGHIIAWLDKIFIDGVVNFIAWLAQRLGKTARSWQLGHAQSFIAGMVLVCLIMLLWIVF